MLKNLMKFIHQKQADVFFTGIDVDKPTIRHETVIILFVSNVYQSEVPAATETGRTFYIIWMVEAVSARKWENEFELEENRQW